MINDFLNLYPAIKLVMINSKNKAFKKKTLFLDNNEIEYLKQVLKILKVFVKATIKLQGEKYPTIYYTIPYIYQIYNKLDTLKSEFSNIVS